VIQRQVADALARLLLDGQVTDGATVVVDGGIALYNWIDPTA